MADTAWLHELYRLLDAHDADGAAAFFADDAEWEIPCIGRRVSGRSAIADFIDGFATFSSDGHDEIEAAVSDGETFAVQWRSTGTRNADHGKFDYSGATIGQLRDGLIARWTDFHDPSHLGR
jgi:ketosteroid isomerase-like protein